MITCEVDKEHYENILRALNGSEEESRNILKEALTNTARQARRPLIQEAQKKYALKATGFNKNMTIRRATANHLEAVMRSEGKALELGDFDVQPFRVLTGKKRPEVLMARVLRKKPMRPLVNGNIKSFVAKFHNKHKAVVKRDESRRMKSNPKKAFLKKLLSPSIPQMLGNEESIYKKVEPEIEGLLTRYVKMELQRALGGKA